ncbi:helix-turn-helix domain-containing protein [Pseudomonas sp. KNUC1026]|uniref:helix-turn-helix domain-containing protein n=1 Tax=Pseudomonas sp. KNUC1026 TaxID=2893890 RepID=UPI001F3089BF|nr:AraC family transcriptional regulator [Pseudomonas sp. KNUC1026]UFH49052.1 AraC family transcriptional regulator [Pseudomonas sp. KNUC1026]
MHSKHWIDLARDADTGIETLRAHFGEGRAYDPHWHDSYLVGVTEQGIQRFNCRRTLHDSTPGKTFIVEPGEIHDGDAPHAEGFTYRMLYLEPAWLQQHLAGQFEHAPPGALPGFGDTLQHDPELARAATFAFSALHQNELRIVRQMAVDGLLERLTRHLQWRQRNERDPRLPAVALRAREVIHAHAFTDLSLEALAQACGVDRYRLTRAFKAAFGLPPHAYLVQLRLALARQRLAAGAEPAELAAQLGFADQSHLGRWFVRAYGMSPGQYRNARN